MVKKNQKQEWTKEQEVIFKKLKKNFINKLVPVVLDLDKK